MEEADQCEYQLSGPGGRGTTAAAAVRKVPVGRELVDGEALQMRSIGGESESVKQRRRT
jgi:hypothetical protein